MVCHFKNHGVVCLEKNMQQFVAKVLWWKSTHYLLLEGPEQVMVCFSIGQVNKKRQQTGHSKKNCIGELFVLGNVICPNSFGNFVRIFKLVVSTHLKNMLVKLDHFPTDWGENRKYLKPPPRKEIQEAFCEHVPLKKIFQQRVYSSEQNWGPSALWAISVPI